MLRPDRVAEMVERIAGEIERLDVEEMLPPGMRTTSRLARRFGLDLAGTLRSLVLTSLRRLPSDIAADPDRAERAARWAVHVAAWLTDQTDAPPPDLELLGRGSSPAIASPSSADPAPASPS